MMDGRLFQIISDRAEINALAAIQTHTMEAVASVSVIEAFGADAAKRGALPK